MLHMDNSGRGRPGTAGDGRGQPGKEPGTRQGTAGDGRGRPGTAGDKAWRLELLKLGPKMFEMIESGLKKR